MTSPASLAPASLLPGAWAAGRAILGSLFGDGDRGIGKRGLDALRLSIKGDGILYDVRRFLAGLIHQARDKFVGHSAKLEVAAHPVFDLGSSHSPNSIRPVRDCGQIFPLSLEYRLYGMLYCLYDTPILKDTQGCGRLQMVLSSYTEDRRDQDGIWRIYVKPGVKMRTAAESFGRVNGADVLTIGPRGRWAHLRDIHGRELTIFADGEKGRGEGRWLTPGEDV